VALVRLNKRLADLGLASRRGAEALILAGQVKVNGAVVTELATKVDEAKDKVEVDKAALAPKGPRGFLLNKPVGYVSTKGEEEGPSIMDLLPPEAADFAYAGRLDKDSRGLVLLLADGRLNYALTAPETHLEKAYHVTCAEEPSSSQLEKLASGIHLKEGWTRSAKIERLTKVRFLIKITEGRNRQIRRMCERVGLEVTDLCRVAIGPLELGHLLEGKWRQLGPLEEKKLKEAVGLKEGEV
jgi:pseudouridine synthase